MAHARFHRLPPERRDAILQIAAEHFAEAGFEGASYNRILESAGLAKSSAYTLFDGKADLYAEVLAREGERLSGLSFPGPPPVDPDSFWQSTRRWLLASLDFLGGHPRTARLLADYLDARRRGAVPDLDDKLGAALSGKLRELIALGRELGAIRRDQPPELLEAMAGAVLAVLDHHCLPAWARAEVGDRDAGERGPQPGPDLDPYLDLYMDTLTRLLAPHQARSTEPG